MPCCACSIIRGSTICCFILTLHYELFYKILNYHITLILTLLCKNFALHRQLKFKRAMPKMYMISLITNMWPNFGKSTIWANLTHEIFSSKKQQLNSKFHLMMDSIYYRYIKLSEEPKKYLKSILCLRQCYSKL